MFKKIAFFTSADTWKENKTIYQNFEIMSPKVGIYI